MAAQEFESVFLEVDGHAFSLLLAVISTHADALVSGEGAVEIMELIGEHLLHSYGIGILLGNHGEHSLLTKIPVVGAVLAARPIAAQTDVEGNESVLGRFLTIAS